MRFIARLIALVLALGGLATITVAAGSPALAKDTDCSDYATQAAAQHYFDSHGGGPNNNVDLLDADGDGIACESNPCPCIGAGGGGGGGGHDAPPPKKAHLIYLHLAKVSGHVKVLGKVPTYRGKFQILRKLSGGSFRFYTRTQARNPGGKVKIEVKGPKGSCFEARVPATKRYRLTTKLVGCIR